MKIRNENIVGDLRTISAWIVREIGALLNWWREPELWIALLAALLLWGLAYQATPRPVLPIGGDARTHNRGYDEPFFVDDSFHESEPGKLNRDGRVLQWWEQEIPPYRWSRPEAAVLLPGLGGGRWAVSLVAASGRPGGTPIVSHWQIGDDAPVTLTLDGHPRIYTIVGGAPLGDLRIGIQAPRFDPPHDPRDDLGLVLYKVSVAAVDAPGPRPPATGQLALLSLVLLVCYSLPRRLALARPWSLALALCAATVCALLLVEYRLALTIWTPALVCVAGICYLLAVLLAPLLAAATRAAGIPATSGERGAALATTIGAFGLRMAGLLHPYAVFSDLGFNVNNLDRIIRGNLFLQAGLPCEAGGGHAPYPPGQYIVLTPLRMVFGDERQQRDWLIQGGNALLESCSAVLIWLALRRVGLGRRAALFGAALYSVAPPLLRSFSVGEFANLFGQSLLLPLLLFLLLGAPNRRRWRAAIVGGLLLLMILLSHTGVTLSVMTLLLAWMPLWWFSQRSPRRRPWPLLTAGWATVLVAMVLFYSSYAALFQERQALAAQQTSLAVTGPAEIASERCPPGYPLGDKLIANVLGGFGSAGALSPMLAIVGAAGVLAVWKRHTLRLDLMLLACWAGTLLSFGTLLNSDQPVRWQAFLFPALCLGAGPVFAAWMRRGRAGATLALVLLAYLTWFGVALWVHQIADYLH